MSRQKYDPRVDRRPPYVVRKQTSGRSWDTFIVVRNPGGHRVTVNPHSTRQGAQADADALNVGAMVKDYADDPRPYEVRRAEAERAYFHGCYCMTEDAHDGLGERVVEHSAGCALHPENDG